MALYCVTLHAFAILIAQSINRHIRTPTRQLVKPPAGMYGVFPVISANKQSYIRDLRHLPT